MLPKKTIFIIPGYRQRPTSKAYKAIASMFTSEGYQSIPVEIKWKQTTISENTRHFVKEYRKIKTRKKYILGFSFGAMIAFLASTKVDVDGLILCSLSPYFQEDLSKRKIGTFSPIQTERQQDFSTLNFGTLVKRVKTEKIHILYGSREARSLIKRVNATFEKISAKQKFLFAVRHADHTIGDKRYLQAIHKTAKILN